MTNSIRLFHNTIICVRIYNTNVPNFRTFNTLVGCVRLAACIIKYNIILISHTIPNIQQQQKMILNKIADVLLHKSVILKTITL